MASDGVHGRELWRTDGTEAGTVMVKDIYSGENESYPQKLVQADGVLYFIATDPASGLELWKSDGTEAGTVLVADLGLGSLGSSPDCLTVPGHSLLFTATDVLAGRELWLLPLPWNYPPSFTKGADPTVFEDAGSQTVPGWATGITDGDSEVIQTLFFTVTNDNNGLFSVQPEVVPDGTLSFTPAPDAHGVAVVTVTLTDDDTGGGPPATTEPQTFTITVNNLVDLSGVVFDDLDNDGVQDAGESGIEAVTVQLINQATGEVVGQQTTDADGAYLFDANLGEGYYRLVEIQAIVLASGHPLLDGIETAGTIGGSVDNTQDSDAIFDIAVGAPGTTPDGSGYTFADIRASDLQGLGDSGEAFDVADYSDVALLDLMFATNAHSDDGILYDLDGDGDATNVEEQLLRMLANDVHGSIGQ